MSATAAETWQQYCGSLPQLASSSIDAAPLTALVERYCFFTSTTVPGTCHKFSPLVTLDRTLPNSIRQKWTELIELANTSIQE